jgi:hypothetical protein
VQFLLDRGDAMANIEMFMHAVVKLVFMNFSTSNSEISLNARREWCRAQARGVSLCAVTHSCDDDTGLLDFGVQPRALMRALDKLVEKFGLAGAKVGTPTFDIYAERLRWSICPESCAPLASCTDPTCVCLRLRMAAARNALRRGAILPAPTLPPLVPVPSSARLPAASASTTSAVASAPADLLNGHIVSNADPAYISSSYASTYASASASASAAAAAFAAASICASASAAAAASAAASAAIAALAEHFNVVVLVVWLSMDGDSILAGCGLSQTDAAERGALRWRVGRAFSFSRVTTGRLHVTPPFPLSALAVMCLRALVKTDDPAITGSGISGDEASLVLRGMPLEIFGVKEAEAVGLIADEWPHRVTHSRARVRAPCSRCLASRRGGAV